jgi:hypothetical protein
MQRIIACILLMVACAIICMTISAYYTKKEYGSHFLDISDSSVVREPDEVEWFWPELYPDVDNPSKIVVNKAVAITTVSMSKINSMGGHLQIWQQIRTRVGWPLPVVQRGMYYDGPDGYVGLDDKLLWQNILIVLVISIFVGIGIWLIFELTLYRNA